MPGRTRAVTLSKPKRAFAVWPRKCQPEPIDTLSQATSMSGPSPGFASVTERSVHTLSES